MNTIDINALTETEISAGSCVVSSNSNTELVRFYSNGVQLVSAYLGSSIEITSDTPVTAKSTSRAIKINVSGVASGGGTGPKGDKGDKGERGLQGIQGLKGDKGDTGAQGPAGTSGSGGSTTGLILDDGREIKKRLIEGVTPSSWDSQQYILTDTGLPDSTKILGLEVLIHGGFASYVLPSSHPETMNASYAASIDKKLGTHHLRLNYLGALTQASPYTAIITYLA